jgi:hypothetical protein
MVYQDSCPKSLLSSRLGNQDRRKTSGDFEMHEKKIFHFLAANRQDAIAGKARRIRKSGTNRLRFRYDYKKSGQ